MNPMSVTESQNTSDMQAARSLARAYESLSAELGKVIVGQEAVIEELLIALFCKGHALLVGVPGLGKDADRDAIDPRDPRQLDVRRVALPELPEPDRGLRPERVAHLDGHLFERKA